MRNFWALDLQAPGPQWRTLEPWPGPARILPVTVAQDGAVYVFSGADLLRGEDGQTTRRFLADAYRYRPADGWEPVASPPNPIVAAPAAALGPSHILVFGGDDGKLFGQQLGDDPPRASREDVLAYHTITDTWTPVGAVPESLATTNAVRWNDHVVIPSGEDRPGHRSPSVLAVTIEAASSSFTTLDYTLLGIYLAALVVMGIYFSRREKSTEDYFLAGRRIPWWAAGVSLFGTQLSAITFMAVPAKVYATDWTYLVNTLAIVLVAPLVIYLYLPFYRRLNLTTAYEYLERRFNGLTRMLASAAFILFQLGRMAIVLYLPAMALSTVTGVNVYICILVMGVLSTIYTVLGGIEAVVWDRRSASVRPAGRRAVQPRDHDLPLGRWGQHDLDPLHGRRQVPPRQLNLGLHDHGSVGHDCRQPVHQPGDLYIRPGGRAALSHHKRRKGSRPLNLDQRHHHRADSVRLVRARERALRFSTRPSPSCSTRQRRTTRSFPTSSRNSYRAASRVW